MEESRNVSDTNLAREILARVTRRMENTISRDMTLWEMEEYVTADGLSHEGGASTQKEDPVQQHLISSVTFRWIEGYSKDSDSELENEGDSEDSDSGLENGWEDWEFENVWDNVCVLQLDDIGQKPEFEWRPLNYSGQRNIKATMAENINIVLLRIIVDWGRLDGNVWSQQVVWSGSFSDCNRVLQLLENDGKTANSIQLRVEHFDLNRNFRDRFIALYRTFPLAAAMAAVASAETVTIDDDGEGDTWICAICHETQSTEEATKRLPCSHLFHVSCIFSWFHSELSRLECPLCRNKFSLPVSQFTAPLSPTS